MVVMDWDSADESTNAWCSCTEGNVDGKMAGSASVWAAWAAALLVKAASNRAASMLNAFASKVWMNCTALIYWYFYSEAPKETFKTRFKTVLSNQTTFV